MILTIPPGTTNKGSNKEPKDNTDKENGNKNPKSTRAGKQLNNH